jgi:hypothetical protein
MAQITAWVKIFVEATSDKDERRGARRLET